MIQNLLSVENIYLVHDLKGNIYDFFSSQTDALKFIEKGIHDCPLMIKEFEHVNS